MLTRDAGLAREHHNVLPEVLDVPIAWGSPGCRSHVLRLADVRAFVCPPATRPLEERGSTFNFEEPTQKSSPTYVHPSCPRPDTCATPRHDVRTRTRTPDARAIGEGVQGIAALSATDATLIEKR